MPKNEFDNPANPDDEETKIFPVRHARTLREENFMSIEAVTYLGVVRLDGIFGRRDLGTLEMQMIIDDLQAAVDFINENPKDDKWRT